MENFPGKLPEEMEQTTSRNVWKEQHDEKSFLPSLILCGACFPFNDIRNVIHSLPFCLPISSVVWGALPVQ